MNYDDIWHLVAQWREPLISFTRELIRTPSLSGREGKVAALLQAEMTRLSYDQVWVDEAGNVIGRQKICIDVLDITPPEVWCEEAENPHGKNIPPAGSSTMPGPKGGQNEDGFYQLLAEDKCDDPEQIKIYVSYAGGDRMLFGPFDSGIVVKLTEDPDIATPECKKMGSSKGQAGAVAWHITLPSDPVITAIDASGNISTCTCLVPPPPK